MLIIFQKLTYSRVFMSTRSQTSRPRKTSTQVFIRIKIQVIYLASNTEIEHTFAEGGLLWLDELLASTRSLSVKNPHMTCLVYLLDFLAHTTAPHEYLNVALQTNRVFQLLIPQPVPEACLVWTLSKPDKQNHAINNTLKI